MRVVPKAFTGFICGQYSTPWGETYEGVMEYADGKQVKLHVPGKHIKVNRLYKVLKKGHPDGLTSKVFTI